MSDSASASPSPAEPKGGLSNLAARLLTAVVAVPILLWAILSPSPWGVFAIVMTATAIALREWVNMTLPGAPVIDRAAGVVLGIAVGLSLYFSSTPGLYPITFAFAAIATFVWFLFRHGDIATVSSRVASTVTGFAYCNLLVFLAMLKARAQGDGFGWVLVVLCVAWLSDTGAYFAGRFLGPIFPRKLYAEVSPKKTVIGALGGVVAAYLSLVLAKVWFLPGLSWADTALVALPANVLGQLGDLAESLVKRSVGVKDSGALLPGHGGMLDRIDAVLFVAPWVWVYATWIYGA